MKTFNDSKSQHLEELEALISSSLSEKELEDRLSDYHDNDIAEILEKLTLPAIPLPTAAMMLPLPLASSRK